MIPRDLHQTNMFRYLLDKLWLTVGRLTIGRDSAANGTRVGKLITFRTGRGGQTFENREFRSSV